MNKKEKKALQEKAHSFIDNPFMPFLDNAKLTGEVAANKLKEELEAREIKTIKIRGAVNPNELPEGYTIVATSGMLEWDKDRKNVYGTGETIIEYNPIAGGIRQNARQDLAMYLGLQPTEKKELSGEVRLKVVYDDGLKKDEKD